MHDDFFISGLKIVSFLEISIGLFGKIKRLCVENCRIFIIIRYIIITCTMILLSVDEKLYRSWKFQLDY